MSFKRVLAATKSSAGKTLAKATIYSTLRNLKAFFEWLSHQPGYRRPASIRGRGLLQTFGQ